MANRPSRSKHRKRFNEGLVGRSGTRAVLGVEGDGEEVASKGSFVSGRKIGMVQESALPMPSNIGASLHGQFRIHPKSDQDLRQQTTPLSCVRAQPSRNDSLRHPC